MRNPGTSLRAWRNGSVSVFQTDGKGSNPFVRTIPTRSVWRIRTHMPCKNRDDQRAAQRAHLLRKRLRCIDYLGGACAICGTTERLEFHHKEPAQKESGVGQLLSRRWDVLVAELDKCELRCDEHHKEFHSAAHGTTTLYHRGCRCEECRAAYKTFHGPYQRAYRDKMKAEDPFFRRKRSPFPSTEQENGPAC